MRLPVPDESTIPSQMRRKRRWVCWIIRNQRKVPVRASRGRGSPAKVNDPQSWTTWARASRVARKFGWGVGYVIGAGEVLIDLDDAVADGYVTLAASEIVRNLDGWTEASVSGTGLHILVEAKKPTWAQCKQGNVEVYDHRRLVALTGKMLRGYAPTTLPERTAEVERLCQRLWPSAWIPAPQVNLSAVSESIQVRVRRARAYVAKMPAAVAGQGGDRATWGVALALVRGFALDAPLALDILREFNERCQPTWTETDLKHKIHMAEQASVPSGYLLRRKR